LFDKPLECRNRDVNTLARQRLGIGVQQLIAQLDIGRAGRR